MKLPILLSVPHAGLEIPPAAQPLCQLTREEIVADGDEGAAEIYALADEVDVFVTTKVARAMVDMNRASDDFRKDGVIKTHTCWDVPIWREPPPQSLIDDLLAVHRAYHEQLSAAAGQVKLGVDGHTMAAQAPPVAPDTGSERPRICLGDVHGQSLPDGWMPRLVDCFAEAFGFDIAVNEPFRGGYITRTHSREMPWLQIEFSRAAFMPTEAKRSRLLQALRSFCAEV